MATLYELTGEFLQLCDMMDDPDVDEQTLADTMEAIGGEIEDKADGYAKIIRDRENLADGLKAEEARLHDRRKVIEANIDRMKTNLQQAMIVTGKTKFKTDLFSFGVVKKPAAVVIDDTEHVPERFLKYAEPSINKTAIKEALEAGEDLTGLAHLEQGTRLSIR